MALRKSKQPFLVTNLNLSEINDAFQRVQDELDRLNGLHGPIEFHDQLVVQEDGVDNAIVVSVEGLHYADSSAQTVHSFGA